MSKNNGGAAFPFSAGIEFSPGMSLRDYFAAQAMAGHMGAGNTAITNAITDSALKERAKLYYRMADAMLEARK